MGESSDTTVTRHRRRAGLWALLALALASASVMQASGWAQTANFALVRALDSGTAQIDRWHWETRDKSYFAGHFYSVKAPGMAAFTLPVYKTAVALGAADLAHQAADTAKRDRAFRWYKAGVPSIDFANTTLQGRVVRAEIERSTPIVWLLGLFGVVLPTLAMLLAVRWCADRVAPGKGTIAAVLLGAGTLVLPFSTLFFPHAIAAALGFAAFAVLWRERESAPRLWLVSAAGLLAGLAVTTEYPMAFVGAIVGLFAISRGDVWQRGLVYAGGVLAGVAPLFSYNLWAFGSPTHFSYEYAVAEQGRSGHDAIGLNDGGFFGIGMPNVANAFDLMLSTKGLLVISPVLALSLVGIVLMHRRGRRAEAWTIGGVLATYVVYVSGYWLPFGGGTPGPRFLIPALPFLAVALAPAARRFPATTLALAVPSVLTMAVATVTLPMIGNGDVGLWVHILSLGRFEHTVLTALGAGNGWLALTPFLLALGAALALGAYASGPWRLRRDALPAALAVCGWALYTELAPYSPVNDSPPSHDFTPLAIAAAATALALIAVGVLAQRPRRPLRQLVPRLSQSG